jgi:hypothetical protein
MSDPPATNRRLHYGSVLEIETAGTDLLRLEIVADTRLTVRVVEDQRLFAYNDLACAEQSYP